VPVIFQYGRDETPIVRGIGQEIMDRCRDNGVWEGPTPGWDYFIGGNPDATLDHEMLKLVLMEMLLEAGVELRLHSSIVSAVTEGDRLNGVIIESKSGREAILSRQAVDATGDGDLAAFAGAEFWKEDKSFCSFGANFDGINKERVRQLMLHYPERHEELLARFKKEAGGCKEFGFYTEGTGAFPMSGNPLDAGDLSRMEAEGSMNILNSLRWARENFPGYEEAQVSRIAPQFGVRFGRRIKGVFTLTEEAVTASEEFEDVICRFFTRNGMMGIPYRALVPEKVDGLIIGSRSYSADRKTFGATRLIGTAYGLGHAAGAAAGLCIREKVEPRELDYAPLKELLLGQKAVIERGPAPKLSGARKRPH
jgi:hypothetical protein